MKHTTIINEKTGELLLTFSSETTWIFLNKDDLVEHDDIIYIVNKKSFNIENDTLFIFVTEA